VLGDAADAVVAQSVLREAAGGVYHVSVISILSPK
jgi:hypothetical protein